LLLQETEHVEVKRGYIYLIPIRQLVKVAITPSLYAQVEATLGAMQRMVEYEQMPEPATNRNYCVACEFRRFCNDI
jgi:CRISPR-associated exonuclease Cas4